MIDTLTGLLDQAERGEIVGLMHVASTRKGDDLTGVCGTFADRLQYAVFAATKCLSVLVDAAANNPGVGNSKSGTLAATRKGVPQLRRNA